MKLKEVSTTYSRTINLGNMQSAKIGIVLTASIEIADDDPLNDGVGYDAENREINVLYTMARDAVHAEMLRLSNPVPGPSIARSGPPASAPAQPHNGQQPAQQAVPAVAPSQPFQAAGSDPFC
jgi:hypothetical protein